MKLNHECIREVLLYLEANLKFTDNLCFKSIELDEISVNLSNYTREDIYYSLHNLNQIQYLNIRNIYSDGDGNIYSCNVLYLTYKGHLYLETIRPKKVWDKILQIGLKVGTLSIPLIQELALPIILELSKS